MKSSIPQLAYSMDQIRAPMVLTHTRGHPIPSRQRVSRGILGSGGIRGKFSSAGTATLNWAGSICRKTAAFTALFSNSCAKNRRGTTAPHP